MKKNILKVVFVAAFALAAGYGVYTAQTQTNLSNLALDNVEALAFEPEWGSTTSPCTPSLPDSCTWVKRIGAQQYLVTDISARYSR